MKTVQEWLRELDTEELIDSYLAQKMLRKEMVRTMQTRDNIIAKDLWLKYRNAIREYIEYLRTVPIEPTDEPAVLYVYEGVSLTLRHSCCHGLVHVSELQEKGVEAEDYSYVLCPHGEVAGFFVADTKRTQDHLFELLTEVLYEASFFGYTKEDLDAAIKEMEEEEKEIDAEEENDEAGEGEREELEESETDEALVEGKMKRSTREEKTEKEMELETAYWKACGEYGDFLRQKALREVFVSVCCGGE